MSVLMLVRARPRERALVRGIDRRVEYLMIKEALGAELVDLTSVDRSRLGRMSRQAGGDYLALAVLGLLRVSRDGVDVVLCDNENEALLLAFFLKVIRRRVPIVTFAINPAARKKRLLFRLLQSKEIRLWLAFAGTQAELLVNRCRVPIERVRILPFHADSAFFDPGLVDDTNAPRPVAEPYVLAVGREDRDYATLVEAMDGLPVQLVIDAGSVYSRSPNSLTGRKLPTSVHLVSLNQEQLRAAYALAEIVVVPTHENDIGAGSTTVLEAMSMARPVVVTRATGSGDLLNDRRAELRGNSVRRSTSGRYAAMFASKESHAQGPHGFYVSAGDAAALRSALQYLLEHREQADEFGRRGRALLVEALNIEAFVDRVVTAIKDTCTDARNKPCEGPPS